ncbi:hypothetical protein WEH80_15255 [Actinomycetes bacterium KLBMP 9759]
MVVTGFDDRHGCGYVLRTGPDAAAPVPGARAVTHHGVTVLATPELAAALQDALVNNPTARLVWSGPPVQLTFDDVTLLGWLRHTVGGVLTVRGEPGTTARIAGR